MMPHDMSIYYPHHFQSIVDKRTCNLKVSPPFEQALKVLGRIIVSQVHLPISSDWQVLAPKMDISIRWKWFCNSAFGSFQGFFQSSLFTQPERWWKWDATASFYLPLAANSCISNMSGMMGKSSPKRSGTVSGSLKAETRKSWIFHGDNERSFSLLTFSSDFHRIDKKRDEIWHL